MTSGGAGGAERGWEHFAHGADVGLRAFGPTREAAFEEAARALTAVVADADAVRPEQAVAIACTAPDDEILLVDWLNALVFEMATRGLVFSRFAVAIDDGSLSATAWGERPDPGRHDIGTEVKGATMTALSVGRDAAGRWVVQCVIDV